MKKAYLNTVLIGTLAFSLTTYLQGCTKDKGIPNETNDTPIDTTRLSDVTYSKDIAPIMTTYCLGTNGQGCHVSNTTTGANGVFSNYNGLKDKVDNGSIQNRVFTPGGGMPPSYSTGPKTLTATDLAVFKKWVEEGAKNN